MLGPLPDNDAFSVNWKNHLRDRLTQYDDLLSQFVKYRTSLAVCLEVGEFQSVLDGADMNDLYQVVSHLLETIDIQLLKDFINEWTFLHERSSACG